MAVRTVDDEDSWFHAMLAYNEAPSKPDTGGSKHVGHNVTDTISKDMELQKLRAQVHSWAGTVNEWTHAIKRPSAEKLPASHVEMGLQKIADTVKTIREKADGAAKFEFSSHVWEESHKSIIELCSAIKGHALVGSLTPTLIFALRDVSAVSKTLERAKRDTRDAEASGQEWTYGYTPEARRFAMDVRARLKDKAQKSRQLHDDVRASVQTIDNWTNSPEGFSHLPLPLASSREASFERLTDLVETITLGSQVYKVASNDWRQTRKSLIDLQEAARRYVYTVAPLSKAQSLFFRANEAVRAMEREAKPGAQKPERAGASSRLIIRNQKK